jgi:hypothetical protein
MPLHHLDILIWDFGFLRIPILELDGIFLRSPVELDDGAGVPDAIIKEHPHVGAQGVFLPRLEAVLAAAGRLCRKGGRVLGTGLDLRSLACSLAAAATALALRDELDVIIRDHGLLHFAVVKFYCVLFGAGVELGHRPQVPILIIKKHFHLRPQRALLHVFESPLLLRILFAPLPLSLSLIPQGLSSRLATASTSAMTASFSSPISS